MAATQTTRSAAADGVPLTAKDAYRRYARRKAFVIAALVVGLFALAVASMALGSANLSSLDVVRTVVGLGDERHQQIVFHIRGPRVVSAIVAGTGLALAGCIMQNVLQNPLASDYTLGVSQGAAFGAAIAIVGMGAGAMQSAGAGLDAVIINNPYLVSVAAFAGSLSATLAILLMARCRGITPEAMVLAGVAMGSLFAAATVITQYFASDVQVASIVFWTFGDLGRASWRDVAVMTAVTVPIMTYFVARRWDYNALSAGDDIAASLGVHVHRTRMVGMLLAALMTAVAVSFLGIIAFIGLVAPHLMRRIIGGDYRFLIPATVVMGALLLLAADTVARTIIAPVVLPVGAITSFMGAPLFIYLLMHGYGARGGQR